MCDIYRAHIDSLNTRVFRLLSLFLQGHLIDHTQLSALLADPVPSLIVNLAISVAIKPGKSRCLRDCAMLDVDAVSFPRLSAVMIGSHVTGHDHLAWPLVLFFEA